MIKLKANLNKVADPQGHLVYLDQSQSMLTLTLKCNEDRPGGLTVLKKVHIVSLNLIDQLSTQFSSTQLSEE